MPATIALSAFLLFIAWMLYQDAKSRRGVSPASWLAVIWLSILGSRTVSAWLSLGALIEASDEADGNWLDRSLFMVLIVAGLVVLQRRKLNWPELIARNRALVCLYLFFMLSVAWSDYSAVSFKRWVKDLGNLVMVLVILSDKDPIQAARAVFVRSACMLIPLSVLFIKYFPELGRSYGRWTGGVNYHGVTTGKNLLGATVLVLALLVFWDLLQKSRARPAKPSRVEMGGYAVLLLMACYLLYLANSATAILCMTVGVSGIGLLALPSVRKRLKQIFACGVAAALLLLLLATVTDLSGGIAKMLGRDPTLTGRDKIWKTVLAEEMNPLVGTGFNSFWLGERAENLSQKNRYFFRLNQAHNGYIELYLNGGIIGLVLLLAVLGVAGYRILRRLHVEPEWAGAKLVFWSVAMIYNWSEAAFFRFSPVWFLLLLVMVESPLVRVVRRKVWPAVLMPLEAEAVPGR